MCVAGEVKYAHNPNQLLLDYDLLPPSIPVLMRGLRELLLTPRSVSYQRSTSHWHVIVELKERLSIMGCVFAQLYLGSDRYRERWTFCHVEHYKRRDKFVQVLFGKKVTI